jgi:hypothetical protein
MMKLIAVKPIDMMLLLAAGNIFAVLLRLDNEIIGVFWVFVAFGISYILSKRSLLSHLWMVIGLAMNPALFLDLGIYKITANHVDVTWGMALDAAFDLLLYFVVMHVFLKAVVHISSLTRKALAAFYRNVSSH